MDPSKVSNGGFMAVMSRMWISAKIMFTASKTFSAALKDTSDKINPFTASEEGCMVARYGGWTTRSPSSGESMVASYGGNSTSRMVEIKTYNLQNNLTITFYYQHLDH